jgi:hypothetical protein
VTSCWQSCRVWGKELPRIDALRNREHARKIQCLEREVQALEIYSHVACHLHVELKLPQGPILASQKVRLMQMLAQGQRGRSDMCQLGFANPSL